jgi:hypothetical protein
MRTKIELERVSLREHDAVVANVLPLILSATEIDVLSGEVHLTVGYRGLPNSKDILNVGDYITIDIPNHGSFEVRLMKVGKSRFPFAIADVSIACLVLSANAAAIESSLPTADPLTPEANTPFNAAEKAEIRRVLQAFREHIRETYRPSEEQDAEIADELRNLSEMLDTLRRRVDWKGVVISALVNIATALALAPEGLRQLAAMLVAALKTPLGLP